jgi:hypothetical protein
VLVCLLDRCCFDSPHLPVTLLDSSLPAVIALYSFTHPAQSSDRERPVCSQLQVL